MSYTRILLGALGLSGVLILTCARCASVPGGVAHSAPPAAAESDATRMVRWHANCFLTKLGLTPRWDVQISTIDDSSQGWYGRSLTQASVLEARISFNMYTLRRDNESLRLVALHEVLHVALGELTRIATEADREATALIQEQLVRQMVRWPSWDSVCR